MKKRPASASLLDISSSDDEGVDQPSGPARASSATRSARPLSAADDAVALAEKRLKMGSLKVYSPKKPREPLTKVMHNPDEPVEVELVDFDELAVAARRRAARLPADLDDQDSDAEREYHIVTQRGGPAIPEYEPFAADKRTQSCGDDSDDAASLPDSSSLSKVSSFRSNANLAGVPESAARYFTAGKVTCSFCKTLGHFRWDCPNVAEVARCFLCGKPGHKSQTCPDDGCPFCGKRGARGHKNCPRVSEATWARYRPRYIRRSFVSRRIASPHETKLYCYVCGGDGHLDCSLKQTGRGRPSCCNCGSNSHARVSCALRGPDVFETYVVDNVNTTAERLPRDGGAFLGGLVNPKAVEAASKFKEEMCIAVAAQGDRNPSVEVADVAKSTNADSTAYVHSSSPTKSPAVTELDGVSGEATRKKALSWLPL